MTTHSPVATTTKRLFDLDDDADYIEVLYRVIFDREADEEGLQFYVHELQKACLTRRQVFDRMLASEEARYGICFKYDYQHAMRDFVEVFPNDSFLPWVSANPHTASQLCEITNPRKWFNVEWTHTLDELQLSSWPQLMHRKGFEWAQTLYGLDQLGYLHDGTRCLGVGSGHEAILYWLANRVGEVVATDLYEGEWVDKGSQEGNPDVLLAPQKYAPFEYREDRLSFLQMDGRNLEFEDNSFDVVFSLSSIEHFGGNEAAAQAMREKARVCRPGGIVIVATELILNDAAHPEFFTLDEIREHIVAASGMKLIQPPEFSMPKHALDDPCVMPQEAFRCPHIVLDFDGVLDTSIILFLRHA